jgi:hypothetical protein
MNCFDANTWIGRWPFAFLADHTPGSLAAHLRKHGISRALVSPLEAVFAPEPGPANAHLLATTKNRAGLEPVPVINPALANWRDELAAAAADPRVRAVRLLPRYHNYRLKAAVLPAFMAELQRRGLRLIVQVRLIDERHEFHAMNLKPVPAAELAASARLAAALPAAAAAALAAQDRKAGQMLDTVAGRAVRQRVLLPAPVV